jgi:hypothetical protein
MSTIKAVSRRLSLWMDESWRNNGAAALLAFFLGLTLMIAVEATLDALGWL